MTTARASACAFVPSHTSARASINAGLFSGAEAGESARLEITYLHTVSNRRERRRPAPAKMRLTCDWLAPTAFAICSCVSPIVLACAATRTASARSGDDLTMHNYMHIRMPFGALEELGLCSRPASARGLSNRVERQWEPVKRPELGFQFGEHLV